VPDKYGTYWWVKLQDFMKTNKVSPSLDEAVGSLTVHYEHLPVKDSTSAQLPLPMPSAAAPKKTKTPRPLPSERASNTSTLKYEPFHPSVLSYWARKLAQLCLEPLPSRLKKTDG
jgi:hypothetical protein